jgi:hypothetical protein
MNDTPLSTPTHNGAVQAAPRRESAAPPTSEGNHLPGGTAAYDMEHVAQLVEHIKQQPALLRHPEVQAQLRQLGKSRLDRYLLTQQLEQAGFNHLRSLWQILDTAAPRISPRLSFAEAKQRTTDEGTDRLVERLMILRGFSILGADAKAGKSTLVRNLIWAVVKGASWLDRLVQQGPVLYYLLEESLAEVTADLEALGVEEHDPITFRRGKLAVDHFGDVLQEDIATTGAILAVIDPLGDMLDAPNFNDYRLVNRALKQLVHVARETGCHILAVHHTTKASNARDAKSFLGSAAIGAATDCNIMLQKDKHDVRYVKATTRYRRDVDIPKTVLDYDPATGRVTLGQTVVAHEEARRSPERKAQLLQQRVLAVLRKHETLSTTELDQLVKQHIPVHQTVVQEVREALLAAGQIQRKKAGNRYLWSLMPPADETG